MQNILVPTDFSENCSRAADPAIQIAKFFQAEIHFLHLQKTPVDWVKLDKSKEKRYPDTLLEIGKSRAALRELDKKAEYEGLKSFTFLQFDQDITQVLEHAGHYHHDFIVTGSSGTKGIVRELVGSQVEQLVRKSDVPVVVVKEEGARFPFKDIVFVSDFMEDVREAFQQVLSLANACGAQIHLLRINTDTDHNSISQGLEPIKTFVNKFPELRKYAMSVYNENAVETGINTYLKHNACDLIAMCTHGTTGFLRLFSQSVAEGVTNHASLPIMTLKI